MCADRHDAIPASLTVPDPDCPSLLVEVEQVQVAQLRPSKASGVESFQDRTVPETEFVGPGGFDKRCHFGLGQDRLRQRRGEAAEGKLLGGVEEQDPALCEPPE